MTPRPHARHLKLIKPTDPLLNRTSTEVSDIESDAVQTIIDQMLALATGKGHSSEDSRQMVGLAAIQIGVPLRVITIDLTADGSLKEQHLQAIINPRITWRSSQTIAGREGCWSAGHICGRVTRAKSIRLEGLDRDGKPLKLKLTDFVARVAQHEIDHLDGIRFPDRIPANKPTYLHWVKPSKFEEYRTEWTHWQTLCPRERWIAMKNSEA